MEHLEMFNGLGQSLYQTEEGIFQMTENKSINDSDLIPSIRLFCQLINILILLKVFNSVNSQTVVRK